MTRVCGESVDPGKEDIAIVPFRADLAGSFATLNEAWIRELFHMEEADRKVLGNPRAAIIDPGGQIFFALAGGTVAGTVAAIRVDATRYELAKMAVSPPYQGRGVGRLLARAAIDFARTAGGQTMFLVTNSVLANAIHLYETLGFVHGPLPAHCEYARSDVYMEMPLRRAGP